MVITLISDSQRDLVKLIYTYTEKLITLNGNTQTQLIYTHSMLLIIIYGISKHFGPSSRIKHAVVCIRVSELYSLLNCLHALDNVWGCSCKETDWLIDAILTIDLNILIIQTDNLKEVTTNALLHVIQYLKVQGQCCLSS